MRTIAIMAILLGGCGKVAGEPDASGSGSADADVSTPDGSLPPDASAIDASHGPDAYSAPDASGWPRVFITTSTYRPSDIGGLLGADALCQNAADDAGLGGTWQAWLASDAEGPATRFANQSLVPYVRLDGQVVANNWADLTDGDILTQIDWTPDGPVADGNNVWSNTTTDGYPAGVQHCGNWADDTYALGGHYGRGNVSTAAWTDSGSALSCQNYMLHLYCFEQ